MTSTVQIPIAIPYPPGGDPELTIRSGPGRLELSAGTEHYWVTGTFCGPDGGQVRVEPGLAAVVDAGRDFAGLLGLGDTPQTLSLALGAERPFSLRVEAAPGVTELSLGGLPLRELDLRAGAGPVRLAFSRPNPVAMRVLHAALGAGRLEVHGLANAGFELLVAEGGAAECVLEFSGEPQRPGDVRLSAAVGRIEIQIPAALPVAVTASSLLGGVSADAGFVRQDGRLLSAAAAAGAEPVYRLRTSAALGKLDLVTIR